ncbi:MAG: DsbA family protein [Pseudomonadota bacterium]
MIHQFVRYDVRGEVGRGMPEIQYFYSTHSAYAYLGARRLMEICAAHGCTLVHRPVELSPVIQSAGGLSFAKRTQPHVDYFFGREIERWAAFRDLPIISHRPTHHDNALHLSSGVLIAALQAGEQIDDLSFAFLQGHWRDDIDLMNEDHLIAAGAGVGVNIKSFLEHALDSEVQAKFEANTQEAIERYLFGSPSYILDGDMYYGQDHLELLEHALLQPFPSPGFKNPSVKSAS